MMITMFSRPTSLPRRVPVLLACAALAASGLLLSACTGGAVTPTASSAACGPEASTSTPPVVLAEKPAPALARPVSMTIGTLTDGAAPDAVNAAVQAGVQLAVAEINASPFGLLGGNVQVAGGAGIDAAALASQGVSAVVAPSSTATTDAVNQITGSGAVFVSPTDTSDARTGIANPGRYFTAVPSDAIQGAVLAQQLIADGRKTVGIVAVDDPYGAALTQTLTTALQTGGAPGAAGTAGSTPGAGATVGTVAKFSASSTDLTAPVGAVTATHPDAVVLISDDQGAAVTSALAAGLPAESTYLVDANALDYAGVLDPGAINCATGARAGADTDPDFFGRLAGVAPDLTSTRFAAEAYDAVNVLALAAITSGGTGGDGIAGAMVPVTNTGTRCTTFAECSDLLSGGVDIDYDGISGPISFDANGQESQGVVSIVRYGVSGTPVQTGTKFGALGTATSRIP
jgi:branched-chain amino acid transport system substrate-binding protein